MQLPPLEVLQPGLSVYEKVTAVRGARAAWGARSPVAAKEKVGKEIDARIFLESFGDCADILHVTGQFLGRLE